MIARQIDEIESLYYFDSLFSNDNSTSDKQFAIASKQEFLKILLKLTSLSAANSNNATFQLDQNLMTHFPILSKAITWLTIGRYLSLNLTLIPTNHSMSLLKVKKLETYRPYGSLKRLIKDKLNLLSFRNNSKFIEVEDNILKKFLPSSSKRVIGDGLISKSNTKTAVVNSEANVILKDYHSQKLKQQISNHLRPLDEQIYDKYCSTYQSYQFITFNIILSNSVKFSAKLHVLDNLMTLHNLVHQKLLDQNSTDHQVTEIVSAKQQYDDSDIPYMTSSVNKIDYKFYIIKDTVKVELNDYKSSFIRLGILPPGVNIYVQQNIAK